MFLRNSKFPFLLLILVFLPAQFVQAKPLTVSEAIDIALRHNPEIISAKAGWESAKARVTQTLSLADPKLGLEYEQIPSGSRNPEDGMKMFTFEQMIMFPGKTAAEYLMAGREAEAHSARYRAKVLEVSAQVKSSYYDLFLVDRSLAVAREISELVSKIKKSAEAKYVVGDAVQADVLQANIEYLVASNESVTLEEERKVKEAKLKALMDQNDEAPIETEAALNFPATLEPVSELEKRSLAARPALLDMKAELEAKDYAHLKSKMEFFPDTALGIKKRVTDGWDAMISFSVPLYFWKQSSGMAAAGLDREAAEASYNNMKNMTIWEVKEAWVTADSAGRTARLYERSVLPQSLQSLKVALAAYQSGKVDFQALLQTERMYKEARLKYFESRVNYGKALAELGKITGGELK